MDDTLSYLISNGPRRLGIIAHSHGWYGLHQAIGIVQCLGSYRFKSTFHQRLHEDEMRTMNGSSSEPSSVELSSKTVETTSRLSTQLIPSINPRSRYLREVCLAHYFSSAMKSSHSGTWPENASCFDTASRNR